MKDRFGRTIDCLRVSVTDRCNLRCRYCMPATGVHFLPAVEILSLEEITEVVRAAIGFGLTRVRLTGGEPLVRRGIVTLVARVAALPGLQDLAMTTNGALLPRFATALATAGLRRVNIHLDTLDPARYRELTRGGEVREALAGIAAARAAGLRPIKLNCVVTGGSEEPEARAVAESARTHGLEVRFIREMSLETGRFTVVEGGIGGDCARCNRLRLTSDGLIKPCLFSDLAFDVRLLGPETALARALATKPESGQACRNRLMHSIGG